MKKVIVFFALILFGVAVLFYGCKKEEPLLPYLSELRENIFEGEDGGLKIKAAYGFNEYPKNFDGKTEKKRYVLSFTLFGAETSAVEYSVGFNYGGTEYKSAFKYDPAEERLAADFFLDGFSAKSFPVTLSFASERREITLNSIIPEGTANYVEILTALRENQTAFIENLYVDGNFSAEIILRVIVKNGKAYYYVGIARENYLKAFLMDGKTKEVLAIREIN